MRCSKCGKRITALDHYYIPQENKAKGLRYCINCARKECIVTLV